ncbi:Oligosaccharide biosynthesis protein Alg14 like protein [compost metagenome]
MFVSSSGGHLSELLKLEKLFDKYNYVLVTEKTDSNSNLSKKYNTEYLVYGSRQYLFKYIFIFIFNAIKSIYLIIKYRPKTIVSTGAHTGGIVCLLGKIFGSKIIYIETLAMVESLSVTGKNLYKFADKFYVQWEELANKYSKAEYIGRLI